MNILCYSEESEDLRVIDQMLAAHPETELCILTELDQVLLHLRTHPCHLLLIRLSKGAIARALEAITSVRPDVPLILLPTHDRLLLSRLLRAVFHAPTTGGFDWLNVPTVAREEPDPLRIPPLTQLEIRRALTYVHEHVFDADLSLDATAAQVPVSRFHFSRLFKKHMGISFREYVIRLRIAAAKQMLAGGQRSVTDVCFAVGYNDLTHFGRLFRKQTGRSPSNFRTQSTHPSPQENALGVAAGEH